MNILSSGSCFPAAALSAALALFAPSAASAGVVNVSGLDWTTHTTSGTGVLGTLSQGNVEGTGSAPFTGILITGPDALTGASDPTAPVSARVTATHTFTISGVLDFNYTAITSDSFGWGDVDFQLTVEAAGHSKNGTDTPLTPSFSPNPITNGTISGFGSINVTAGDTISFFVESADQDYGAATLEISNLTFTPVPEPASLAVIAGAGLVGFAAWRRRSVSTR